MSQMANAANRINGRYLLFSKMESGFFPWIEK
jgi:hypothetical protein